MRWIVAFTLLMAAIVPAQASLMRVQDPPSLGVSCETVRSFAQSFTRPHLEKMATAYGVTPQQRREAMACLRRQPSKQ